MNIAVTRIHRSRAVLVALAAFAALGTALAQDAGMPRASDGKPDLNGVWQVINEANWNVEPHIATQGAVETLGAIGAVAPGIGVVDGGRIPYLPAALEQRAANFAVRRTEDPEAKCFMTGVPRATYMPYPFQIVQSDTDMMILYQYTQQLRTIFMGDHVKAPVDSWMGWSNGRWEGDTLVVEVTAQNANWLDRSGNFASEARRVVERYTPQGRDHILYQATIEDPQVFSAPWSMTMHLYRRKEANARLLDFRCVEFAEEMMYGHLRKPGTGPESEDKAGE